uniref:Uncharacterized protein n=1 Tax=Arundo donax TaxID=35708 RepID=A0A0A9BG12_ARUDO
MNLLHEYAKEHHYPEHNAAAKKTTWPWLS